MTTVQLVEFLNAEFGPGTVRRGTIYWWLRKGRITANGWPSKHFNPIFFTSEQVAAVRKFVAIVVAARKAQRT